MKVALNLEAASWLGGRYYLQNLALALRAHAPEVELVAVGAPDAEFAALLPLDPVAPGDTDVVFPIPQLPSRVTWEEYSEFWACWTESWLAAT